MFSFKTRPPPQKKKKLREKELISAYIPTSWQIKAETQGRSQGIRTKLGECGFLLASRLTANFPFQAMLTYLARDSTTHNELSPSVSVSNQGNILKTFPQASPKEANPCVEVTTEAMTQAKMHLI